MNDNDETDDLTVLRQEQEAHARRLAQYGPPNAEDYPDDIDNPRYWQDMAGDEDAQARRRGFADAAAMGTHERQQQERRAQERAREMDLWRAEWATRWRTGQVSKEEVERYSRLARAERAAPADVRRMRARTLEIDAQTFGLSGPDEYLALLGAHEERYGLQRTTLEGGAS